ncbi:MAG: hypothetical protein A3G15_03565 [Candidatus Levybacteria bacterium RIFCSPLOWO2_12_FULL_40_10]|nr:MAG: hypothetical protein A3G15_03565 [Candidatus Levybacteria bacterium RIFCSPLOWO2_12_FULL_40_10]
MPSEPSEQSNKSIVANPQSRENITALSRLDPRATQVLNQAQQLAKKNGQQLIEPMHLLYGLIYDGEIFKVLEQFGVDGAKVSQEIEGRQEKGNFFGQPTLSDGSKEILEEAYGTAKQRGASFISPEDILLAVFQATQTADLLKSKGIDKAGVEEKLSKSTGYVLAHKSMIEKYSIDLTVEAHEGRLDPVAGRDREIERLIHILLRRTKNNPIIIGEAGVGKTAIVEGLAQKIVDEKVPKDLSGRKIMQLDMASLIAGAAHRGEFEERFRAVIKEAQASSGQLILFIDEIHSLIGAGDTEGSMDASNIIKPYLARGQIQLIGTTTTAEYRKYFEKDKAFERRFQPILAEEPSEEAAIEMLKVLQPKYEKFHNVTFSKEALESAVHLSKKYVGERFLPDKAVDLLDEAGAEVKLTRSEGKRADNEVKKEDIEKVVSAWTGIPITKLTEDESQKLIHLEELIHKRFINQEEAVVAIAEAIRRGRIGLSAAGRPIASFIFLGPTGVGKTELAKAMAEILFGKEEAMIRLDMSEYMEKHEVAKLIGAPPGYVGYEEGGQLTEAVRTKPYSIVLLDEVEKAHPDVFNILLQLLEDGRLTDNKGNTISFKNTVIIATSNIGSKIIQEQLSQTRDASLPNGDSTNAKNPSGEDKSFDDAQGKQAQEFEKKFAEVTKILLDELHKFFRPELLNRFDELVVFKPLNPRDMILIAKLGIEKTRKLLRDQKFDLEITEKALNQLAKEGYDPIYGARPLRRLIQTVIENPISLEIIGKNYVAGDTILIDFDEQKNEFIFSKTQVQKVTSESKTEQESQTNGKEPVYGFDNDGMMPPVKPQEPPSSSPPVPHEPPADGTQMQKNV